VTETIDLVIPPGFPNKDKIVMEGMGNEHPDYLAGDFVVVVTVI
jgi:DnaJ-class molecular chaperone